MLDDEKPWPAPPTWLNSVIPRRFYENLDQLLPGIVDPLPPLPALKGHSAVDVARWIGELCNELGTTPAALAKEAKLAASTLNRFLREIETGANVSAKTIEKIRVSAESKLVVQRLIHGDMNKQFQEAEKRLREQQGGYLEANVDLSCDFPYRYVSAYGSLRGTVCNYHFYNPSRDATGIEQSITIPLHYHLAGSLLGFDVNDQDGATSRDLHGQLLFGVLLCTTKLRPRAGSLVIAFRRQGDLVECGAWRLDKDPAGRFWLMPIDHSSVREGVFLGEGMHGSTDRVYVALQVVSVIGEATGVF